MASIGLVVLVSSLLDIQGARGDRQKSITIHAATKQVSHMNKCTAIEAMEVIQNGNVRFNGDSVLFPRFQNNQIPCTSIGIWLMTSIEGYALVDAKAAMTDVANLGMLLGLTKLSIIGSVASTTCYGFSSEACDIALTRLAAKRAMLLVDLGMSAATNAQVHSMFQALKVQMQKCISSESKATQQASGCAEVTSLTSGYMGTVVKMQAAESPASVQNLPRVTSQAYADCIISKGNVKFEGSMVMFPKFQNNQIPCTSKECVACSDAKKVAAVIELVKQTSIEPKSLSAAQDSMTDLANLGKALGMTKLSIIGSVAISTCYGFSSTECTAALTRLACARAMLVVDLGVSRATDPDIRSKFQALKGRMQLCIDAVTVEDQKAKGCSEVSSLTSGYKGTLIKMETKTSL